MLAMNTFIKRLLAVSDPNQMKVSIKPLTISGTGANAFFLICILKKLGSVKSSFAQTIYLMLHTLSVLLNENFALLYS